MRRIVLISPSDALTHTAAENKMPYARVGRGENFGSIEVRFVPEEKARCHSPTTLGNKIFP